VTLSPDQLRQFNPFQELSDDQLERLSHQCSVERIPKGSFIFKRGKDLPVMYYLVSGTVDLVDASFNSEKVNGDTDTDRCRFPLAQNSPSPVSAMAKSNVEVLCVEQSAYSQAQAWAEEARFAQPAGAGVDDEPVSSDGDWMVSLLDSPLFSQIPPTQIQRLFTCFEPVKFAAGDQVVKEGTAGGYFYVIESGEARVRTLLEGEVATLAAGQYFGEEALIGGAVRNATVEMTKPGVLMRLCEEEFRTLIHKPLIHFIDADELEAQGSNGGYELLDVRLPTEYRKIHVKGSTNIPLAKLRKRMPELDKETVYVVTDDGGKRSEVAAHLMCQAGFNTYILRDSHEHYEMLNQASSS